MPWWLRVLGEDEARGVETDPARSQRLPLVRGAKAAKRAVFEDRRPRLVGDSLTVQIVENISASQKSTSTVDRSAKDSDSG